MDLATLIGIVGAIGLLIMAMLLAGDIMMFVDAQSVIIVFGGSIFVVLSNYNLGQFFGIGKIIGKAFMFKLEKPEELIEKAVDMADAARKGGFLATQHLIQHKLRIWCHQCSQYLPQDQTSYLELLILGR